MKPTTFAQKFPNRHEIVEEREEFFQTRREREARLKELEAEGFDVMWHDDWRSKSRRLWWLEAERILHPKGGE